MCDMSRGGRRVVRRLGGAGVAAVAVALALPAMASAFSPVPGRWNGGMDGFTNAPVHFQVGRSGVVKFTIPTLECESTTGVQFDTVYIPRARVRGRSFTGSAHPIKGSTITVKGTFTSAKTAKGVVLEKQPCNPGTDNKWTANLGRFKPPRPPAVPTCLPSGCQASDGMFIKVVGVDRTITPTGDPLPDPEMAQGGVAVTIDVTDRSSRQPIFFAPATAFQLRLGNGQIVQTDDNSNAVGSDGTQYTCDGNWDTAQLTRGASYGPVTLCYDAPTAAERSNLTLDYNPQDSIDTILAKMILH